MANPLPDEVQGMAQPLQTKPVTGGYSDVGVDDEDVKMMADFAVASMNEGENLKLMRITAAARQVVAGSNYKLKMNLLQADGDVRSCEVIIFDQPWTNTRKLNQISCIL